MLTSRSTNRLRRRTRQLNIAPAIEELENLTLLSSNPLVADLSATVVDQESIRISGTTSSVTSDAISIEVDFDSDGISDHSAIVAGDDSFFLEFSLNGESTIDSDSIDIYAGLIASDGIAFEPIMTDVDLETYPDPDPPLEEEETPSNMAPQIISTGFHFNENSGVFVFYGAVSDETPEDVVIMFGGSLDGEAAQLNSNGAFELVIPATAVPISPFAVAIDAEGEESEPAYFE